jgi:LysR family transcriptional regulator, glycine cleavage system transcriptional activator
MSYQLPPLNGLRAFEASGRHLSFKRAAGELGVTAGAVSQQVKALEAMLGIKLFRRLPRGLLLTSSGEGYLPSLSNAFRAMSEATERVAPVLRGRRLRLGIAPTITAKRYPAIAQLKRPEGAQLCGKLIATDDVRKLIDGEIDVLVRTLTPSHPGLHLDQVELGASAGARRTVTVMTLPGLAGCREHKALLKMLRG